MILKIFCPKHQFLASFTFKNPRIKPSCLILSEHSSLLSKQDSVSVLKSRFCNKSWVTILGDHFGAAQFLTLRIVGFISVISIQTL